MFEGLFQPMHLLVIALIALIFFGPRKLPELGRGLGDGIREFKRSMGGLAAAAEREPPKQGSSLPGASPSSPSPSTEEQRGESPQA